MLKLALVSPLVLLSACATVMSGTSQTVTVSTNPPAATCTLDRVGQRVGAVPLTPGSVRLDKSKNDLSVTCSKEGYQTASVTRASSFNGATFGNIIAGGVIGVIVDASSGANFNYPSDIRLDLAANSPPTLPPTLSPLASQVPAADVQSPIRLRPATFETPAQSPLAQSPLAQSPLAQRINATTPAR